MSARPPVRLSVCLSQFPLDAQVRWRVNVALVLYSIMRYVKSPGEGRGCTWTAAQHPGQTDRRILLAPTRLALC